MKSSTIKQLLGLAVISSLFMSSVVSQADSGGHQIISVPSSEARPSGINRSSVNIRPEVRIPISAEPASSTRSHVIQVAPKSSTLAALTDPSSVIFADNFDTENGGSGELNYFGLGNWNVTAGSVDLIGNGFADFLPGNGLYLDLDGTTFAAGTVESKPTFTFVPATYRLQFSLAGSQLGQGNRVDVRLGQVYSESFFLEGDVPFTTITRDIVVSTETSGKLIFQAFGNDNVGLLLDNIRLLTNITEPLIFNMSPDHGGNTGRVTANLSGINLPAGPVTVKLSAQGQPDITAISAAVISPTQIVATFDLTGAGLGLRDAVVTFPGGLSLTRQNAFTIEPGSAPQVWVDIIGRDTIRPGRPQTLTIVYGTRANIDVEVEHLILVSYPANGDLVVDRAMGAYGAAAPPPVLEGAQQAVAILVPQLRAQGSGSFTVRFTTPTNGSAAIRASIISIRSFETTSGFANQTKTPQQEFLRLLPEKAKLTNLIAEASDETPPVGAIVYLGPHGGNPFGHQAAVGVDPVTNQVAIWDHFLERRPYTLEQWKVAWPGAPYLGWGTPPGWTPAIGVEAGQVARSLVLGGAIQDATAGKDIFNNNRYSCAGLCEFAFESVGLNPNLGPDLLLLPAVNYRRDTGQFDFYEYFNEINPNLRISAIWLAQLTDPIGGWLSLLGMAQSSTEKVLQVVAAMDPNYKTGSLGTGGQHFTSGEEPLRYAIYFENVETATAPAQEVVITDQLDTTKLDLNTFSFGPIAFGNKLVTPPPGVSEFNQDVDLRPANDLIVRINARLDKNTGLLTWRFASIDPATGLPVEDPLAGFLPPNVNAPEGDGSVLFTVMPKQDLVTGTEVRNQAQIVFDTNASIDTPQWFNTVDNSAPASSVHTLTATPCSANLNVQWSGTDTGSGIRDYTVYVSDNGGPFTIWQSNTTATSGSYSGQFGHTYSFHSVAQDNTGNVERAPATPDATVTLGVIDNTQPVITLNGRTITLWPADHKYKTVKVSDLVDSASDSCDAGVNLGKVVIAQVSSDEPDNGSGDGDSSNDMVIAQDCKSVQLRAERDGKRNGRVYTITFKVKDGSGNVRTATAKVTVPKSQNGSPAVNDGSNHTVMGNCP